MQNQQNLSYRTPRPWRRQLAVTLSKLNRGLVFGAIMFCALLAFELFNYTTTDFALQDFLGDIRFLGLRWAMILAIAFCAMDFAGIARLFAPAGERGARTEVWYLLGAWFLAATMNAMLTWWGVSLALLQHKTLGNEVLNREQLVRIVPVFVAVLVWLIRILMIGTFSMAGERLFARAEDVFRPATTQSQPRPVTRPAAEPAPRPVRMLGNSNDDDFDQTSRAPAPREVRYHDDPPREERPRPPVMSQPVPEVRRAPVERATVPPVPPSMPAVRPAPKPSVAAAAQALGGNGAARPVAPRPAPVNGRSDTD